MIFAICDGCMARLSEVALVVVRFGKGPNADTLYAGHCEATPEGVAALLGVSPLVARRALRRAGRFVPVPSSEHDDPLPMFVSVITEKIVKGYGRASAKKRNS